LVEGGLRVDTMQMAFDAATHGVGVVLGRGQGSLEEFESGRLLALGHKPIPSINAGNVRTVVLHAGCPTTDA
jgi:LysR family transcriptional regulator, glycine cleavage system transcriptional activator